MKIREIYTMDEIRRAAEAYLGWNATSDYYALGREITHGIEEEYRDENFFEALIWSDSALEGWYVERPADTYEIGMEREFYLVPDSYDMRFCDPDEVACELIEAGADYDRLFDILNNSTKELIYNEFINFAAAHDMLA